MNTMFCGGNASHKTRSVRKPTCGKISTVHPPYIVRLRIHPMSASLAATAPAMLATVSSSGLAGQMVTVPIGFEMLAVVAASITGALTAREQRLDLVGAVCLAVLCSLGGGVLRDVILQVGSVYILDQPLALPAAVITAAIAFVIPSLLEKQDRLIAILDIFAVGLFAATGADKAYVYGFEPIVCVMMGFFTAVGGGMLRDICLGRTPNIFQRSNFYAVAAIGGAIAYVLVADAGVSNVIALIVCVSTTMLLRFISLAYDIKSPADMDIAEAIHRSRRQVRNTTRPETTRLSLDELEGRRERVQADIARRRHLERRKAALDRLRKHRKARAHRKLDV